MGTEAMDVAAPARRLWACRPSTLLLPKFQRTRTSRQFSTPFPFSLRLSPFADGIYYGNKIGAVLFATPTPEAGSQVGEDEEEAPQWAMMQLQVENASSKKEDRLPREAREILQALATKWGDEIDSSALQMIPLKGAMTNEVFQMKWPTKTEDVSRKVLVRIYGEGVDVFFNREDEIKTFEFMSKHGQGPRLLGRFSSGRIEEFIHARTLSAVDLRDPEISSLIAFKMKEFHDLDIPGPKNVCLWNRLRNWLIAAKKFSPPEEAKAFRLDSIEEEISLLEKDLLGDHQSIGFCHNDLQYGNIMLDEETSSITIIDYEYASYNPIAFDIANHFCEMTADYHTDTPHVLDYTKYPGLEERKRFVQKYMGASGNQPSDDEVDQLVQDVEKYTLASHLVWGLWGIISDHVNEIDFDYIEYARQRFEHYWSRKRDLLGSVAERK